MISVTLRLALVVFVGTLILVYSIIPLPSRFFQLGPLGLLPIRAYLHFIAYAGFGVTLAYVLADAPYSTGQILLGVFAIAVSFGVIMELIQLQLPFRQFSYIDISMNAAGTAVAVFIYRFIFHRAHPVIDPECGSS